MTKWIICYSQYKSNFTQNHHLTTVKGWDMIQINGTGEGQRTALLTKEGQVVTLMCLSLKISSLLLLNIFPVVEKLKCIGNSKQTIRMQMSQSGNSAKICTVMVLGGRRRY